MRGPTTTTKKLSDEELKSVVENEFPMLASPEGLRALQQGVAKPRPRKKVTPLQKEKSAFTLNNDVEVEFPTVSANNKKNSAPAKVPA